MSSPAACRTFSSPFWRSSVRLAESHGGTPCCSSCFPSHARASLSASVLKAGLAFACARRALSSDRMRYAVAPRELVAAMQVNDHRQYAGGQTRGSVPRVKVKAFTHSAAFSEVNTSCITRATPP
eukprot:982458-Prymnesium_polylepis.1